MAGAEITAREQAHPGAVINAPARVWEPVARMYTSYFGIDESPFAITPDPRYLYMSEKHQEALAHLLYGITSGGGVVVLTGEVGTGKTTISRALLDQLPDDIDVALCLNPRLDEVELLANLCDELKIPYARETASLKSLVDLVNTHLLEAHAAGRHSVLIIDEAQNLSPRVLEQLRLLTNLETSTKKLLQIVLIGQPELNDMLARPDMRQMAQRITARFHLLPLNAAETEALIGYRLSVAGLEPDVIDKPAVRLIHRMSGGVPRLINILCDRCLLAAYARNQMHVDRRLAQHAATEVLGAHRPRRRHRAIRAVGAIAAMLIVAAAGVIAYQLVDGRYAITDVSGDRGSSVEIVLAPRSAEPVAARPITQVLAPAPPRDPPNMEPPVVERVALMPSVPLVPVHVAALSPPPLPEPPPSDELADVPAPDAEARGSTLTIALAHEMAESDTVAMVYPTPQSIAPPVGETSPRTKSAKDDFYSGESMPVAHGARWAPPGNQATGSNAARVAAVEPAVVADDEPPSSPWAAAIPPPVAPVLTDAAPIAFGELFSDPTVHGDLTGAVHELFSAWDIAVTDVEAITPCVVARENGLHCLRQSADWQSLSRLNRPALVQLGPRDGPRLHAVVTAFDGMHLTLSVDGRPVRALAAEFVAVWSGDFLLLWRPTLEYKQLIQIGMSGPDVAWVRDRFAALDGELPGDDDDPVFDPGLQQTIMAFQRRRGLVPDGIVGPLTLIELNTVLGHPGVPMLRANPS